MVYTLIYNSNNVIRDSDGAIIPDDPKNTDWIIYTEWYYVGNNTPNPAVIPPPYVPFSVSLWQAKAVLQTAGLLTASDAAIAAANNPILNQFWNSSSDLLRSSPTLISLGSSLGLSNSQIDTMFIEAAALTL